ncbi:MULTISPECIES: hypothetical protein [unclassified Cellulophaga]|uniref:hypothetical protein n=1 Tax=unclassified Cellulophaga TaxID=2634405 RepID=UPI0026E4265C|nr:MULTISPECIES: hypothetical protein [unclassified Cellulophaga]MDO6492890.1 hypothetical protein [Cellulophaga sp. 2_MG-2023]MDO6496392.1 hypothetical protein [Cellulophaga sp. 3_MG-2023]
MTENEIKILSFIIPGLVAIIGNYIFYLLIKNRVDKQIENYKISYSGVFKEKIEIHKNLLKMIFNLKRDVQQYQYFENDESFNKIRTDFNNYIEYYIVNQPFIKEEIIKELKQMTSELQECFEAFSLYKVSQNNPGLSKEAYDENTKKYIDAGNKIKRNEPFKYIEEKILKEMKADLKIEK